MCANFSIWLCFLLEEIHSEHLAGDLAVICSARGHFTFRAASSRLHFKVHRAGLCGYSFCSGFWRYDHMLPATGSLNEATGSFSSLQHIFLLSLFIGFIFTSFSHSHLFLCDCICRRFISDLKQFDYTLPRHHLRLSFDIRLS